MRVAVVNAAAIIVSLVLWAIAIATLSPSLTIDWTPILRFIAPMAFETRPLEVLIEGGHPE